MSHFEDSGGLYANQTIFAKWLETNLPDTTRGEESAIEAVSLITQHYIERGTVAFFAFVCDTVQIELDFERGIQLIEFLAQVFGRYGSNWDMKPMIFADCISVQFCENTF